MSNIDQPKGERVVEERQYTKDDVVRYFQEKLQSIQSGWGSGTPPSWEPEDWQAVLKEIESAVATLEKDDPSVARKLLDIEIADAQRALTEHALGEFQESERDRILQLRRNVLENLEALRRVVGE